LHNPSRAFECCVFAAQSGALQRLILKGLGGRALRQAWWRLNGWGAGMSRRKEGEWGEGPSLAITTMFFSEFAEVFRLSLSMRKVTGEHPFCVLIYMNSS